MRFDARRGGFETSPRALKTLGTAPWRLTRRSLRAGWLGAQRGDVRAILWTIEEGLLGDELVTTEKMGIDRPEPGVDASAPRIRVGQRAEVGEDVHAHRRNAELNDETGVQQSLDRDMARCRPSEEVRQSLDETLSIGAGGRDEQIKVLGGAWPRVESKGVGPPMR
jgi:hypothetical protein